MDRLPQRVDDLAEEAFNVRCSKDEDDTYNGPPPQELSVQKFRTPQNWAGPLNVTDKKVCFDKYLANKFFWFLVKLHFKFLSNSVLNML